LAAIDAATIDAAAPPPPQSQQSQQLQQQPQHKQLQSQKIALAPPVSADPVLDYEEDLLSNQSTILYGQTEAPVRDYAALQPLLDQPVAGDHLAWQRLILTGNFEPALVVEEGVVEEVTESEVSLRLDDAFLRPIGTDDWLFECAGADDVDLEEREKTRSQVTLPLSHQFLIISPAPGAARARIARNVQPVATTSHNSTRAVSTTRTTTTVNATREPAAKRPRKTSASAGIGRSLQRLRNEMQQ
jgi:hypothetical protein